MRLRTTFIELAALTLVGGGVFWWASAEPPPSGSLWKAVRADPRMAENDTEITDPFLSFLPDTMVLEEKAALLEANGFTCTIGPIYVEGDRQLVCDREVASDWFCHRVVRYFTYVTPENQYLETLAVKRTRC